jgi:transcription-repair coupling factor (superfamily II helicase)
MKNKNLSQRKRQIKTIAAFNVDTLTFNRRHLYHEHCKFSLMAARDLSVITTPPPNRYPIETTAVVGFSEEVIGTRFRMKFKGNGQVFSSLRRIENIKEEVE